MTDSFVKKLLIGLSTWTNPQGLIRIADAQEEDVMSRKKPQSRRRRETDLLCNRWPAPTRRLYNEIYSVTYGEEVYDGLRFKVSGRGLRVLGCLLGTERDDWRKTVALTTLETCAVDALYICTNSLKALIFR